MVLFLFLFLWFCGFGVVVVFKYVLYENLSRWFYGRPNWFIKSIQVLSRYSLMNYFSLMLLRATTTVLILNLLWVLKSVLYVNLSRCFYGRPCWFIKSIQVLSRYFLMNYFSLMLTRATTTLLILNLLWVFEFVLYENLSRWFYGRPCCNKKSRF